FLPPPRLRRYSPRWGERRVLHFLPQEGSDVGGGGPHEVRDGGGEAEGRPGEVARTKCGTEEVGHRVGVLPLPACGGTTLGEKRVRFAVSGP
ncbi:MAG TPA: hypothetical protein VK969_01625, partial [Acidimicrobiia bacterium]|nr:hypothetical protein [Acidimicrobiia bacterium]